MWLVQGLDIRGFEGNSVGVEVVDANIHQKRQEIFSGEKYEEAKKCLLAKAPLVLHMTVQVPFPILITKEKKWFVASCPLLDIATQGKTEKEVKENMAELIGEYLSDPDTVKPSLDDLMSLSLTNIPVKVPEGVLCGKTSSAVAAKSN